MVMNPRARLRTLSPIAALALTAATLGRTGSPANAAAADITCEGTSPTTFTPGLTFTAQPITYTETDTLAWLTTAGVTSENGPLTATIIAS